MQFAKNKRPRVDKMPVAFPQVVQKQAQISAVSNWTLSYRLRGLACGLIISFLYCYFISQDWAIIIIISSGILGYFLGWVVGRFSYTKS